MRIAKRTPIDSEKTNYIVQAERGKGQFASVLNPMNSG
jgi:hypothetical protein